MGDQDGDGGTWCYPRDRSSQGTPWWREDYQATLQRFPPLARKMLASEIKRKMERGMEGRLTYGHGREYDVEKMASADHVLELRLTAQFGDEPITRLHTRIYFNEPSGYADALWLLALRVKHDDPPGHDEQNEHVRDAAARLTDCEFLPLQGVSS
ncbi:hypothetical protein H1Q78_00145 [Cellulosimicrobium cellulans]|uniref:hypothetical protein n=1 Tax=Cellulosimicrobium cellulans TaxID=1710 RepID=UPI001EDB8CCF|nr:hypothetical protein [Cellulosimicrobium cellulans]UKJ63951.1 hypothetical protein H1Q78_00145 [Cellulosimicrobium cellulans]